MFAPRHEAGFFRPSMPRQLNRMDDFGVRPPMFPGRKASRDSISTKLSRDQIAGSVGVRLAPVWEMLIVWQGLSDGIHDRVVARRGRGSTA